MGQGLGVGLVLANYVKIYENLFTLQRNTYKKATSVSDILCVVNEEAHKETVEQHHELGQGGLG